MSDNDAPRPGSENAETGPTAGGPSPHPLARLLSLGFKQLLSLDPATARDMSALAGRCIALHVTGVNLTLYIQPTDDSVLVSSEAPKEPEVTLSGSPFALARMSLGREPGSGLFDGAVQLRGDTGLGQRFQDVIARMEIDWEGELARYTGDIAAHQVGSWARDLAGFGRRFINKVGPDTGEYLSEEARLIIPAAELAAFCDDVDTLRADVDRFEARLRLLEHTPEPTEGPDGSRAP
ncbi:MAG: ubiquinone biosynthesis accessory factor UbiJ [Gammaproteobacteria bacterium]